MAKGGKVLYLPNWSEVSLLCTDLVLTIKKFQHVININPRARMYNLIRVLVHVNLIVDLQQMKLQLSKLDSCGTNKTSNIMQRVIKLKVIKII